MIRIFNFIDFFYFRTGFAGPNCEEITDICSTNNPCRNGARCIGEKLGRFKCQCVPGWEGPTCDKNIGEFGVL
ncbi:hypothetical protein B9Z55_015769 [Caenorhabditis nigoni]|uniref:EGF-like domain-containing protein n=1 Tax=Caenorhabditis nigoni TaxID=1611254 RepID=A0A2G5UBZ7_9PELO|nr:hypothetical protein B9Z55_015769 [Caenorhabditis nigoni]